VALRCALFAAEVVPRPGCECQRRRRPSCALLDCAAVFLGHAAAHRDLHVGTLLFERFQVPEGTVELEVRVLTDRAGIEHHDVGDLVVGCAHQTVGDQETGQALGVVLVHLTAKSSNGEGFRAATPLAYRATSRTSRDESRVTPMLAKTTQATPT